MANYGKGHFKPKNKKGQNIEIIGNARQVNLVKMQDIIDCIQTTISAGIEKDILISNIKHLFGQHPK